MLEVFKTNITSLQQAESLVQQIRSAFQDYEANFDLQDCDKILRVKSGAGIIHTADFINFLNSLGCVAEVLSDDVPCYGSFLSSENSILQNNGYQFKGEDYLSHTKQIINP